MKTNERTMGQQKEKDMKSNGYDVAGLVIDAIMIVIGTSQLIMLAWWLCS